MHIELTKDTPKLVGTLGLGYLAFTGVIGWTLAAALVLVTGVVSVK